MLPGLPQTLTARVWQLAAVAMAAVVVLCLTTYWHLDTTQDADDGVAETLQVLRQINRVGQNTSDAKTAHLRFVLTGRDEYLASPPSARRDNAARSRPWADARTDTQETVRTSHVVPVGAAAFRQPPP